MNETQLNNYLDMLEAKGFEKADKYKNSTIPNKIYKYFPLTDESDLDESNKRVFKALLNEELWLSSHKRFNDPLEFESMYIDKESMISNGFDKKTINVTENFYNQAKSLILVSCFSKVFDNMSMWHYYANVHKGICVEYEIIDKRNFYPVIYNFERCDKHKMLVKMINTYLKIIEIERYGGSKQEHNRLIEEQMKMISLVYINFSTKKSEWSEEKEIRLIYSEEKPVTVDGKLIDYLHLRINPTRIILGNKCSKHNEKLLRAIGQQIGVASIERFDIITQYIKKSTIC